MIQIVGTKKCKNTQQALRFFKDRSVLVHFLDVSVRPLSKGELDNCIQGAGGVESLLDRESTAWKNRGLSHMLIDEREELLADMGLLKTPVVRQGKLVRVGNDEAAWKSMAASEKK